MEGRGRVCMASLLILSKFRLQTDGSLSDPSDGSQPIFNKLALFISSSSHSSTSFSSSFPPNPEKVSSLSPFLPLIRNILAMAVHKVTAIS